MKDWAKWGCVALLGVGAFALAFTGAQGWGWFLLVAFLVANC